MMSFQSFPHYNPYSKIKTNLFSKKEKKHCKTETNLPTATTRISALRQTAGRSDVLVWIKSPHLICHLWILPDKPFCYDFKKAGVSSTHLEWQTVTVAFIHFSNSGQQEDSKWYIRCRSLFLSRYSYWPHWSKLLRTWRGCAHNFRSAQNHCGGASHLTIRQCFRVEFDWRLSSWQIWDNSFFPSFLSVWCSHLIVF